MKLYACSDRFENESTFFFLANSAKEAKKLAYDFGHYDEWINIRVKWEKGLNIDSDKSRFIPMDEMPYEVKNELQTNRGYFPIYLN